MKRIFIDTNVLIDVLLKREGYIAAARILALRAKDFEDALQYFCAQSSQCDVIITRNEKDFYFSELKVLSPDQFLSNL